MAPIIHAITQECSPWRGLACRFLETRGVGRWGVECSQIFYKFIELIKYDQTHRQLQGTQRANLE